MQTLPRKFGRFSDTDGGMNVTNEIVAQIYERNNSCWLSSMQQLYRENVSVVFSRRDNRYKQNMKFLSEEVENNSSFKSSILWLEQVEYTIFQNENNFCCISIDNFW